MSIFESIEFYEVLKILITVVLTSGLTYYLGVHRDKGTRIFENSTKLLDEVYEPIMRIMENNCFPAEGYDGISESSAIEIVEIIRTHSHIVDKELVRYAWALGEDIHFTSDYGGSYYAYDGNRKLLNHVDHMRNKLKKKLNRPYDPSAFKLRRRMKNKYYDIRSWGIFVKTSRFKRRSRKKTTSSVISDGTAEQVSTGVDLPGIAPVDPPKPIARIRTAKKK